MPLVMDFYRDKGIPPGVMIDTFGDLVHLTRKYHKLYHVWGVLHPTWFLNLIHNRIFRLGRLQFKLRTYQGNAHVFRNRNNGIVLVLSEQGVCYRSDGQIDGTNHIFDLTGKWTSQLEIDPDNFIEGHPIDSDGNVSKEMLKVPYRDWKLELFPSDQLLDIHIP